MSNLRVLLSLLSITFLLTGCPLSNDDDSASDDDDATSNDDDAADDDDSADDDDATDDDDSASPACSAGASIAGAEFDVLLAQDTLDAPVLPGACVELKVWGFDSNIADQAANLVGTFMTTIEGLPTTVQATLAEDAHDLIDPGGDTPADNRFYVTGWVDVDGDGVEGVGDYTSGKPPLVTDPPAAVTLPLTRVE